MIPGFRDTCSGSFVRVWVRFDAPERWSNHEAEYVIAWVSVVGLTWNELLSQVPGPSPEVHMMRQCSDSAVWLARY